MCIVMYSIHIVITSVPCHAPTHVCIHISKLNCSFQASVKTRYRGDCIYNQRRLAKGVLTGNQLRWRDGSFSSKYIPQRQSVFHTSTSSCHLFTQ